MHVSSNPLWPPALRSGARVALISPSGPLRSERDVDAATTRVRDFGWEPVVAPHARRQHGYLAGTDAERLADLQWALDDTEIDAVWCLRGGYGLTRILPQLSLARFIERPKCVLGYSDVTALHLAIAARSGIVSFHAPGAREPLPNMSASSLVAAVTHTRNSCGEWPTAVTVRSGAATGMLAGGNLALLASLAGTSDRMQAHGKIVVLEDVQEPAYRVDRMLRQLEQSGALTDCAGLAVGQFTAVPADSAPDALSCTDLIDELAARLGVPCLRNLPIGHIDDQWTLPLGAIATLDASARSLTVQLPLLA
jgi:muramoyltetrapeptide carboxypeptidase